MKYRHRFHAGNFADVHKHVTLLALLHALQRKEKGFLYLETHAGRGRYDLSATAASSAALAGVARVRAGADTAAEEIRAYAQAIVALRRDTGLAGAYPGSPLLAAGALRRQDRAVLIEIEAEEAQALATSLPRGTRARIECADGFEVLRSFLPPPERRGLVLIDPPYEQHARDLERMRHAILQIRERFATGVVAAWYPIKDRRDDVGWQAALARELPTGALLCELWMHPCDNRVALNGSGLLLLNPPFQPAERMRVWLPQLQRLLDPERLGGTGLRALT